MICFATSTGDIGDAAAFICCRLDTEIDPVSAWSRLAMIDRKKDITSRDLAVIDLRVPHQLVVEPNIPVRGKGSKT